GAEQTRYASETKPCRLPTEVPETALYMTMPARRSIPNVTKSTGVQTSPDLKKRYQTFPFERKKGNVIKHTALVENYPDQNNGFLSDVKGGEQGMRCEGRVQQTRVLLHTTPQCSDAKDLCAAPDCSDGKLCPDVRTQGGTPITKDCLGKVRQGQASSPTVPRQPHRLNLCSCTRKKDTVQLNGLQAQSQALPHSASCASQAHIQAHCHRSQHLGAAETRQGTQGQLIALPGADGNVKARLQAMEALINSSQETIKELERGEAQREG
ncbi:hypothetical protein M9458_034848, partial [Cirrhinus mrigala]